MKRINSLIIAVAFTLVSVVAQAAQITVTVKGMVCSFCAQGIEKKFKNDPALETVHVDLAKKLVLLTTKDGQTLSEDSIRKKITDAGFNVVSVEEK